MLGLAALLVIVGGAYTWYSSEYGGKIVYVKIQEDGKLEKVKSDDGRNIKRYNYSLNGYDKGGQSQKIKLSDSRNLRHDAYLKVLNNKKKGVMNWEEVYKKDIPEKALGKIEEK
ncbi:YxeA family protein [Lactococcus garvieae]|uniref:YxeA family protein n=1 Tax=Lactococcus garvieae TaxID=1363 RepID=UPI001E5A1180|nr:YxeA family protein [Lactococcus garvieae]